MSTQPSPPPNQTGDQIHAKVGKGARGVAVGKNIIQIGSVVIPFWLAWVSVGLLTLGAGGTGYTIYQNSRPAPTPLPMPTATVTPLPTATPLATATEAPGETLLIIAPFDYSGQDVKAHIKIARALNETLQHYPDLNLRVAVDDRVVLNADQRDAAEALAKRYNAGMVIWGEDTVTELRVNLLNLRTAAFADTEPQIVEREDVQLKGSDGYIRFVNEGLPNQMTFLALLAIAEAQLMAPDFETQQQTVETLQAALALNPVHEPLIGAADAYFTLGWFTFYYRMDFTAAIDAFSHVVALEPKHADAHFNLAEIYDAEGQYEEALDHYTAAIEAAPLRNPWAYAGRAELYTWYLEAYSEALADYTTFLQLQPDNPYGYSSRSDVLMALGNWDAALADINRLIELTPPNANHYETRAHIQLQRGEWQAALTDIDQALALNPAMAAHFYQLRSQAHMAGQEWQAAVDDLNAALDLAPENPYLYFYRAQALIAQGQAAKSLADLHIYLDLQPDGEFAAEAAALLTEIEKNE